MYTKMLALVERGKASWSSLSVEQQSEMDKAVALLREAADQGHPEAQGACGDIYNQGHGVATDDHLAFVYHEKAAQQGNVVCQYNIGLNYRDGLGCDQNYERAAEWFEKAACGGDAGAMTNLGALHYEGKGVRQSYERAIELFKQGAAHGHPVTLRDQTQFHIHTFT